MAALCSLNASETFFLLLTKNYLIRAVNLKVMSVLNTYKRQWVTQHGLST